MADCSYSRCIQQKRNIRRELQRWTKNMVYIVGLERIAEELMGRRKWKLYQESMSRNYLQPLNNNVKKQTSELETAIRREASPDVKNHHDADSLPGNEKATTATPPSENGTQEADDDFVAGPRAVNLAGTTAENGETVKITAEALKREEPQGTAAREHKEAEDRLKDWSPQSKCYFCVDGKLDSEQNNHGGLSPRNTDSDSSDSRSDIEPLPTLTPSIANNHHHPHRNMTTVEQNMAVIAAVTNAINSGSPVSHMPFYPQFYPLIGQVAGRGFHVDAAADVEKSGEEPLDLSSKSSNNGTDSAKMPAGMRVLPLDTKFSFDFRAKPRMPPVAGRRTYTEDELQAALRDIQSGKLGTRRAAVIYGIPRSTLRNKVYKLALERERESHLNPVTLKLDDDEPMDEDKDLSGAEEEKEVEKALEAPLISVEDILRLSNIKSTEALRVLLKGKDETWLGGSPLLLPGPLGPKPQLEADVTPGYPNTILREVLRKMVVEEKLRPHHHNNGDSEKLTRPSPSNSASLRSEKTRSESDMETDEAPSNVILKIPSFKPTTASVGVPKNGCDIYKSPLEASMVSPPVTSESSSPPIQPKMTLKDVKDVIAKSISVKFQQSPDPMRFPIPDLDMKRGFTPPLGGISVIQKQHELPPRPTYQQPQSKPPQSTTTTTTTTTGGKGTRPKRGKYRNYDRDSLVEAVRAVQRGEMSVHRAGSYYGVPHSTLEYKVKERHLMRPRKRDPKPNPVDEKIASLKQNDLRNAAEKFKPNPTHLKPLQRLPPTSPNGRMPIIDPSCPIPYGPPFPFWHNFSSFQPAAFPTNPEYYASQMMQKLQEESRTHSNAPIPPSVAVVANPNAVPPSLPKNTRQIAESLLDSGANGSFLDGIIRSSLESGVPSEDKSLKEDKTLTPENMSNKALLDQLCRNSRLTPLPKISEPSSSSSDESYKKGPSPREEQKNDQSPKRNDEVHTIDSSNDSNDAHLDRQKGKDDDQPPPKPPGRIYLKTELANPDNLKPEMLMRFRDVLRDVDRNGVGESTAGSASDTDAVQD